MQAPRRGSWIVGCLRKTAILSLAVALPSALARGLPEASSEAEPDALRAERTEQDQAWRYALGVPTQCGDPVATDCFMGTFPDPYCNDECNLEACAGCCDAVCAVDPLCCVSANEAVQNGTILIAGCERVGTGPEKTNPAQSSIFHPLDR